MWLPPSTATSTAEEDRANPPGEAPLLLKPWRGREDVEKVSSSSAVHSRHRSDLEFFARDRLLPGFSRAQCISKSPVPDLRPEKKQEAESSVDVCNSDQFRVTSLVWRVQGADSHWRYGRLGAVGFKVCRNWCSSKRKEKNPKDPQQEAGAADCGLSLLVWPSTTEKGRFIKQG